VRGHAERLAAERLEVLLRLGARVGLAARHHHLRAGGDEALGNRAPDAARAAGDERHAPGEIEELPQTLGIHRHLLHP
jgi:hypothetical protein